MAEPLLVFRMRFCRASGCGARFWICRSCDRGHRYCSPSCRSQARRKQCREANRRHQQSPEGRADHRDRQRAYRRRQRARVTDQGRREAAVTSKLSARLAAFSMPKKAVQTRREAPVVERICDSPPQCRLRCIRCGRHGRFVDPFAEG